MLHIYLQQWGQEQETLPEKLKVVLARPFQGEAVFSTPDSKSRNGWLHTYQMHIHTLLFLASFLHRTMLNTSNWSSRSYMFIQKR